MLNQNTNMNTPVSNKRTTQQLHDDLVKEMLAFAYAGESSRSIAKTLGVSKSSVNNYVNRSKLQTVQTVKVDRAVKGQGPRVLVYDLETAPALSYTFGRFKQNISQDGIVEEGGWIICASYRWLGEKDSYVIYDKEGIRNRDDSGVVAKLWELYEQADAVVAHNALGFDHKVLQGRCLVNNMPPLPSVKVLDTLVMAKKHFRLPSNKLDSIAEILGLDRKLSTGGISLWVNVLASNEEALEKMLDYCQHDTDLLTDVYLALRSFGNAGSFNAAHYHNDDKVRCPVCGSHEVHPTDRAVYTEVSKFQEMRCDDCGALHRTRQALNTKDKRSAILGVIKV